MKQDNDHPNVLAAITSGVVDDVFVHAADCGLCRVALLELDAFPAGCVDPELGHHVLSLLDRVALGEEKDERVLAHLEACPSCAVEAQDAVAAAAAATELADRLVEAEARPALTIGLNCVFCHDGLVKEQTVYCAACLAPHHSDCFREHGRCSVLGCEETSVVAARRAVRPSRVLAAIAVALLSGVGAAALVQQRSQVVPAKGGRETPTPTPTQPASGDPLLARVDRVELRRSDLDQACELAQVERFEDRMQELSRLIERAALLNRAVTLGLTLSPAERTNAKARAQFTIATRSRRGSARSEAALEQRLQDTLLIDKLVAQQVPPAAISDDQVRAYYRIHAHRFRSGGETRLREIVLFPNPKDAARIPSAIQERIGGRDRWDTTQIQVEHALAAPSFEAAQKRLSMGSTEEQVYPADVSEFLMPELALAVNRIKIGRVFRVRLYTGTTHIVKVIGRRPPGQQSLAEASAEIRARLQREADADRRQAFVDRTVAEATIETFLGAARARKPKGKR